MSPFKSLYYKEFREHRLSLFVMLGIVVLVVAFCSKAESVFNNLLVCYVYLYGFYVTATAAMSYAKEEESGVSRFLRALPVSSVTIFRAKLAWLGTVMLLLALPAFYVFCVPFILREGVSIGFYQGFRILAGDRGLDLSLIFVVTIFSLLSWGYFCSTRFPNKLFATLLSICCVMICWLCVGGVTLRIMIWFCAGERDWMAWTMIAGMFVVNVPVAVLGIWRAATYFDRTEPEDKRAHFLNSERKEGDRRVRLVTRLFPRGQWTPFQALL